jgi:lipopolysaccharide transport system ATP-binding protein
MSDVAIKVENLSKQYKIGVAKYRHDSIRDHLTDWAKSWFTRNGRLPVHSAKSQAQSAHSDKERLAPSALQPSPDGYIWALKDVSFEVKQGEMIGIIGKNGAGKSTLLKVISHIVEPTSGFVDVQGRVGSLLEVGTGFHRDLTGRENVYLNGAILGMKKREINRKFDEIIDFAEIENFIDTPVKRYSSGMYVRLAFAVAAHLEPEILILDEVLSVGDTAFQLKCLDKIEAVIRDGRTVLFVSHSMSSISSLTSRCLWFDGGRLLKDDPTGEVCPAYLLSSQVPQKFWHASVTNKKPMQVLRVELSPDGDSVANAEINAEKELTICIDYVVRSVVCNAVVDAQIHAPDGAHIISLEDSDQDAYLFSERRPGTYRTRVKIPVIFLNSGTYLVRVGCGLPDGESWDNIKWLTFKVTKTHLNALRQNARQGYSVPMLKWETEALDAI